MKYLAVALLSVLFFALTYASAPNEFSDFDLAFILTILTVAISAELSIVRLLIRNHSAQNLLLALFALINIYSLNLNLNTSFLNLTHYLTAFALLAGFFILFTLMNIMDDVKNAEKIVPIILILAITGVTTTTLYAQRLTDWPTPEPGKTSASNIDLVDFKSKPNVYFVSFDALTPKILFKKYLGVESAPYHSVLDANFRRIPNFFADRIRTKKSLNSLLALDIGYFDNLTTPKIRNGFYQGLSPSPLLELFKHNGYETNTFYRGLYFGQQKGPYVDHYLIAHKVGVCDFIKVRRAYSFLGYCGMLDNHYVKLVLKNLGIYLKINANNFLLKRMRAALKSKSPQFFLAYLRSPVHVRAQFDYNDPENVEAYRQRFIRNSITAAQFLKNIVRFISSNDPNAILYVFGDHGSLLSQKNSFSDDSVFVVQDQYGVYGGIRSKNACVNALTESKARSFTTVSQGARMIIQCLAGGDDPFSTPIEYRLPSFGEPTQQRYEDFLYE